MKTSTQVRRNGSPARTAKQVLSSTPSKPEAAASADKTMPTVPAAKVADRKEIILTTAVFSVLQQNSAVSGLTPAAVAALLPVYGITATEAEVERVLFLMSTDQASRVEHLDGGWVVKPRATPTGRNAESQRAPSPLKRDGVRTSAPAAGDVSLILFHHGTDQTIAQVDLTSNEFAALKQLVGSDVAAIGRFIEQAIREWIRHSQTYNAQQELTDAIDQAHALNELLEHHFIHPDDGGVYCDSIQCGLGHLGRVTFDRLRKAGEQVLNGKDGVR